MRPNSTDARVVVDVGCINLRAFCWSLPVISVRRNGDQVCCRQMADRSGQDLRPGRLHRSSRRFVQTKSIAQLQFRQRMRSDAPPLASGDWALHSSSNTCVDEFVFRPTNYALQCRSGIGTVSHIHANKIHDCSCRHLPVRLRAGPSDPVRLQARRYRSLQVSLDDTRPTLRGS